MANEIRTGDNLLILREMDALSVSLVYLDPPFNSGRNYNVTVQDSMAHEEAYQDTWTWDDQARDTYDELQKTTHAVGRKVSLLLKTLYETLGRSSMLAYLVMMAPRLLEIQRVLKKNGSIYLHCDPNASHYLKILCDFIFGADLFRSEIIWKRTSSHNDAIGYGSVHDVILFYRGDKATWNPQYGPYDVDYVESHYWHQEPDGRRFRVSDLSASGLSGGGYTYEWNGVNREWRCPIETMRALESGGLIYYSKNGLANRKRYLDVAKGVPLQDIWSDIHPLGGHSKKTKRFDGQKPESLLERIIRVSSNEGDLVLDPFLGSGTTAVAAQRLGRKWIGIELTPKSAKVAKLRLDQEFGEDCYSEHHDNPADLESARHLAKLDAYKFQCWVVRQLKGMPTGRGRDGGVDGNHVLNGFPDKKSRLGISQVTTRSNLDHFKSFLLTVQKKNVIVGLYVTFRDNITSEMKELAAQEGTFSSGVEGDTRLFPKIQLICVENFFDPNLELGGARVPGFVKEPDYAATEASLKRGTREGFNIMLQLSEEEPQYT